MTAAAATWTRSPAGLVVPRREGRLILPFAPGVSVPRRWLERQLRTLLMGVSQYLQPLLLQSVYGGGAAQAQWTGVATQYLGVSTQAYSSSVTDASLLSGEPTSAGNYGRIVVTNNNTNFPAASGSNPATSKLHVAQSFAVSSAAWSTATTPLQSVFGADAATLAGGNVLWSIGLSPATDIVDGSGITFTFAIDAVQFTLGQS